MTKDPKYLFVVPYECPDESISKIVRSVERISTSTQMTRRNIDVETAGAKAGEKSRRFCADLAVNDHAVTRQCLLGPSRALTVFLAAEYH